MSQRDSGYARVERDRYETPEWASLAVVPHLPANLARIWEPASGTGKMVRALQSLDLDVTGSDIADGADFFAASFDSASAYDAIVTNRAGVHRTGACVYETYRCSRDVVAYRF